MESPPDPDSVIRSLSFNHSHFISDMEQVVNLLKKYKTRCEELEMMLLVRQTRFRGRDAQTQTEEEAINQRFDRRTISESGVQMSNELERVHAHNFSDIWSFNTCLGSLGIPSMSDGWGRSVQSTAISPPMWDSFLQRMPSPLRSSETPSEASERRTDSGSSDRIHPEDDDFDLHEIEQAIRESQCDDAWQLAGITKEKKSQKPPLPPCTKKPVQPQEAKRKAQSKRVKVPSESSIPSRRSSDDRKGAKNVVATLPTAFVGKWYPVKSCAVGGNNDGRWKDQKKDRRKEPRIYFKDGPNNTYIVHHKKFTIKDALFYEHCGGQRCIVLKDRPNSILIRNKQLTYTFTIQPDNQLLETFKDDGVEYKVLSAKE